MSRAPNSDCQRESSVTEFATSLRESAPSVVERCLPLLRDIAQPYRDIPREDLNQIVIDYVSAFSEAIERHSLGPLDALLGQADQYWATSGLSVSDVMSGIDLINDAVASAVVAGDDDLSRIRAFAREAARLVIERFVAAINRNMEGELERHRLIEERLFSLQRVSAIVLSEVDLTSMLQTVVGEAMQLIGAQAAVIRLADSETATLKVIASTGRRASLLHQDAMPIVGSLAGYAYRTGEPVISNDVQNDSRLANDIRSASVLRSLLIVPLVVRESSIGVVLVSDRIGGPFTHEDQRLLGMFADQAAAAIEHAKLHQQAQHQIAELAALHRISNVISSSLEIEDVFWAIYQEIREVMTADAFLIGLVRPDGLVDLDFIIDGDQRYAPRRAFELSPAMDRARTERRAVVIDDTHGNGIAPMHTVGHPQTKVRSIVTAPLLKGSEVVGLLSAQSYELNTYHDSDAQLLMTIANQAVVSVEHARLYRQAQSLAIAEERNRLAREIHDTLAQGLVGIILQLERLDLRLAQVDDSTRDLLDRALSLARDNLEEARRSVHDLRAAPLEGRTLLEALHHLIEDLRGEGNFAVELRAPMSLPLLPARVETALFRVVQEAISNCRKHAQCSTITVDVDLSADVLSLAVTDNGRGFKVDDARLVPDRYGLSSMYERVSQIGGTLDVRSHPGDGTSISLKFPLNRTRLVESENN